jgi:NitT/TauT family transport system ATP-binding protein
LLEAPVLSIRGIEKTFRGSERDVVALGGVDLDVQKGEFISLVGPSGCGKTTLLRIIDGLDSADAGTIELEGKKLNGVSQDMAYVFQDINLLPWRSVRGNVELGLEARGVGKAERRQVAEEALEMVGLKDVMNVPPYTLSGGMQQRVGVARALAVKPKVLLMDEPFGQLDNFTREALQAEVAALWSQLGITIVFVTHDVDESIYLSDRIVVMQGNPGRVIEILNVHLARPREQADFRAEPETIELRSKVTSMLRSQAVGI